MDVDLPGLMRERLPSGNYRYRVRVAGNKRRKITLTVTPDHDAFLDHYRAARRGEKLDAPTESETIENSLAWLISHYVAWLEREVEAGRVDTKTLKQRRSFYNRLIEPYGAKDMIMPVEAVIEIRNSMFETPGAADNMVKAIRAMYHWATSPEQWIALPALKRIPRNPAVGVSKINTQGKGATPWSIDDLRQYRKRHPLGSMAHLALSLFMFTACRIEDVVLFGRHNETKIQGTRYLSWQPGKKGSRKVTVPIVPPLERALAAQTVVGQTYLLRHDGQPFATSNSFDNWFRKRIIEAGLCVNGKATRSSHGIRKAAGELLALEGATQYHIMAVHGHSEARTSEVYTAEVNRQHLARDAMAKLATMEW